MFEDFFVVLLFVNVLHRGFIYELLWYICARKGKVCMELVYGILEVHCVWKGMSRLKEKGMVKMWKYRKI